MRAKALAVAASMASGAIAAILFAQSLSSGNAQQPKQRYLAEYTAPTALAPSGDLKLPPNEIWRDWVYVGSPLTPNALNGGQAGFPDYHNVYIEPESYATYRKTNAGGPTEIRF